MSGSVRGGGGGARVSIPANARRMISDIKDLGYKHSDDEIYAMLKDCAMDPNEAAQRLLLQDPFHEVKRKREKRKENAREPAGPTRWRPGVQGHGGRGGHGIYSSRGASSDDSSGRAASGKENGPNQRPGLLPDERAVSSVVVAEMEGKLTSTRSSSSTGMVNCPNNMEKEMPSQSSREKNYAAENRKGHNKLFSDNVKGVPPSEHSVSRSEQFSSNKASSSFSAVYASSSDPVLVPSIDARSTGKIGIIKRVVESQQTKADAVTRSAPCDIVIGSKFSTSEKGSFDGNSALEHEKTHTRPIGYKGNQSPDTAQVASPSMAPPSSRPSSNYSNCSQQSNSSQKAVPNKEWKPKSVPANSLQVSAGFGTSESLVVVEAIGQQLPASSSKTVEETTKKLEELQLAERHVIIPSHIQVSETEIQRLSFGSFDASFKMNIAFANGSQSDRSLEPLSDRAQELEENEEHFSKSIESVTPDAQKAECPDHPQTSSQMPENSSLSEAGIPNISSEEQDEGEHKPSPGPEVAQFSVVQTAPYSSFDVVPQMTGNHLAPFDSSESQVRDSSGVPSFVVQQPFDPAASYYAQFYRPSADADGRFSPSLAPGSSKYNGNITSLPAQTNQSPQEGGNPIGLSAAGSTPPTSQTAGATQSPISVTQQPVPVFRHPAGLHLSHYPPSYLPYGQYFSPFFVPPPLHHFVTSPAFPQQPPSGNTFLPPGAAATPTPVKYSLAQYKPGNNPGNSAVVGMIPGYGNYNSSPVVSNANSTDSEDLNSSQFNESNVYHGRQQSETPALWIPTPGRDLSALQASSFYSLPPQGQHVTFSPSQAAHGGFSGIYHPAPTVATSAVHPLLQQSQTGAGGVVEMIGPPAGIYQQPHQRSQINWTNNY